MLFHKLFFHNKLSFSFNTAFLHWDLDKIFCVSRLWILFSQYFSLWWIKLTTLLALQYWAIVSTEWWGVWPRCRLLAYGPADATVIPKPHHLLPHVNTDWFYLSVPCLPRLSWKKKAVKRTGVVVAAAAAVVSTGWTCYIASTTRHCAFTFRKCLYDC